MGATGRTGNWVVKEAVRKGYEVNCLVRSPQKLPDVEGIHVFVGNAINVPDLKKAVAGCGAVISALNISFKSNFPWSPLSSSKTYMSDVMKTLVPVVNEQGLKRVIVCTALGVGETRKDIPFLFRLIVDHSNIGYVYQDHERQEAVLRNSDLDWTIVRPTGLTNSEKEEQIKESFGSGTKLSNTISRKSVGRCMVEAVGNEALIGKAVGISKA